MKQKTDEEILAEIRKILEKFSVLKNYRYDRKKRKLVPINKQRLGQRLVNYIRIKHKCSNERVHGYLWNMNNEEFMKVVKGAITER